MDPNENLSEQRKLAHKILQPTTDLVGKAIDADRLAILVQGMDDWIRAGGVLPRRWRL